MTANIAIIFPAYNEEITIDKVLRNFYQVLPNATFYVIDNASSDQTNKIAKETLAKLKCRGSVIAEKNKGKGNALRRAFLEIKADVYVVVDADLTYDPKDLAKIIEPIIKNEADMVVGDRLSRGSYDKANTRRFHGFGNKLVKNIINFLFRKNLSDIMSGYRAFSAFFVNNFPILSTGFEIETEMTLHALDKKFRIVEVPVQYQERPEGSFSKINTFKDGARVIATIFNIFKNYKPLSFFSILAGCFFCFGLIFGLPVILEFMATHFITKVPSAILASGLMIIALLLFGVGVILDTIVNHYKTSYQLWLLKK